MPTSFRAACLALLLTLGACVAPDGATPGEAAAAPRWHAVMVAGDPSLPVWDNATVALAERLRPQLATLQRYSARPQGARTQLATTKGVLDGIARLRPAPGEGCLVFATMHGAPGQGLAMIPSQDFLPPAGLDRALDAGCGEAPTVVILSGCYTGFYTARPLARPNRVVLAAARADRPSFGCGAGREFTVYDRCLIDAVRPGESWAAIAGATSRCVAIEERRMGISAPSEPQTALGASGGALLALR